MLLTLKKKKKATIAIKAGKGITILVANMKLILNEVSFRIGHLFNAI